MTILPAALSRIPQAALTLLPLLVVSTGTKVERTCTLTHTDKNTCLAKSFNDGEARKHDLHDCVWCSIAATGYGFCVEEIQAFEMKRRFLGMIDCELPPSNNMVDDGGFADDYFSDDHTNNDDHVTPSDDRVTPSDDSLPDDFWTCLQNNDSKECLHANCTWCESVKNGFGLCMTGPSADSAVDSNFFTCTGPGNTKEIFCAIASLFGYDLNGMDCNDSLDPRDDHDDDDDDNDKTQNWLERGGADPYDPVCALAYFVNPTEDGCRSTVSDDGVPCEYCRLDGSSYVCMTHGLVEIFKSRGKNVECSNELFGHGDSSPELETDGSLFDASCLMDSLNVKSGAGTEECTATRDGFGEACEIFSVAGVANFLCLTNVQSVLAQKLARGLVSCGSEREVQVVNSSDKGLGCLQKFHKAGCVSSTHRCSWCTSSHHIGFCVDHATAKKLEDSDLFSCSNVDFPLDPLCLAAAAMDADAPDACDAATDSQGAPCVWCSAAGVYGLCMSTQDASIAHDYLDCDDKIVGAALE